MLKKKLLFVIDSLVAAGAEKSLVTLLNELDYSKIAVDLQLFSYGGHFQQFIPKEVNLLPPLAYFESHNKSVFISLKSLSFQAYNFLIRRYLFSFLYRLKKRKHAANARLLWQCAGTQIRSKKDVHYDFAIAYAQGLPTFYVAHNILANKKAGWVNVSYYLDDKEQKFQKKAYEKLDYVVPVSETAGEAISQTFPFVAGKLRLIRDINSPKLMNLLIDKVNDDRISYDGIKLLTIGRFVRQKGFDLVIEAAELLKNIGIKFRWFIIGDGALREELECLIQSKGVVDNIKLLGVVSNPYYYIQNTDIYVQPSRNEGFGLALLEARSLMKPCVVTNFEAAPIQIQSEKNGLIVDMNARALADGIQRMIEDKRLRKAIFEVQKHEKFFNTEEINNFYKLIDVEV